MKICLLGPMMVFGDGKRVHVRGRRVQRALAFLVLHRKRPVPTHELADILWPGGPPASWPSSTREVVSKVRAVLADAGVPTSISTVDRCLHMTLPHDTTVDVDELLGGPHGMQDAGIRRFCDAAHTTNRQLLELAEQAFLAGDEDDWARTVRRRLHRARTELLHVLGEQALVAGTLDAAAAYARSLILAEPLSEAGPHLLMRVQQTTGDIASALQTFDAHRRLLDDELGITPPARIADLHVALLRDEAGVDTDDAEAVPEVSTRRLPLVAVPALVAGGDAPRRQLLARLASSPGGGAVKRSVVIEADEPGAGRTTALAQFAAACPQTTQILYASWSLPASTPGLRFHSAGTTPRGLESTGEVADPRSWHDAQQPSRPLVILLDDVHLATEHDAPMLRWFARLAGRSGNRVVVTHHPGQIRPASAAFLAQLHQRAPVATIALPPLTIQDITTLCRAADDPTACPDAVLARSNGNVALARALLRPDRTVGHGAIGAAARALVVSWLARLDDGARQLLLALAFADRGPHLADVASAAGLSSTAEWLAAIEELMTWGLVDVDEQTGDVDVRHGIVEDVLIAEANPIRRTHLESVLMGLGSAAADGPIVDQRLANAGPTRGL